MKKLFLIPFLLLGLMVHGQDSTITKVSLKGRMFSIVGTGGTTDLQYNAEERAVESSTGNSAVLPLATTSAHGLMDFTDKIKIGLITLSGAIDLDALSTSVMDKEDTSNKATSLASPDNTKYPTTLAVSTAIAAIETGTAGLDQEVAIPKTLGTADAWKIFKNTGTTDVTYTIPTQANEAFTEDIAYTFWVGDTGKIFVKGQTGAGVPAREISTVEKYATITRFGADNWTWGGTTLAWSGCDVDPNQIHVGPNAASDPNCNEANATTGWSAPANSSVATSSTESVEGLYSIIGTLDADNNVGFISTGMPVTAGDTFNVSYYVKKGQGNNQGVTAWTNCTGGPAYSEHPISTEWQYFEFNITAIADGGIDLRFYTSVNTMAGNSFAGDQIFVDNLSVVKTN